MNPEKKLDLNNIYPSETGIMLPLKKNLGFNLRTRKKKKNKRHGSIKLDLKIRGDGTLACILGKERVVLLPRVLPLMLLKNLKGKKGYLMPLRIIPLAL